MSSQHELTNVVTLSLSPSLPPSRLPFSSHLLVSSSFFLVIGGPLGFDFGIGCQLTATFDSSPQDRLVFGGKIKINEVEVSFEAETLTPWVHPFGAKGPLI